MFTGLIEAIGQVVDVSTLPGLRRFRVRCSLFKSGSCVGDSIAIDGCCLTAVALEEDQLTFDLLEKTSVLTHLIYKQAGETVHVERALQAQGRLGGHFVYGHIDQLGEVISSQLSGEDLCLNMALKKQHAHLVIPQGSIALDGVSLTVANVASDRFSVHLIPHTLAVTHLGKKRAKDTVNLEFDVLGKYLARQRWGKN